MLVFPGNPGIEVFSQVLLIKGVGEFFWGAVVVFLIDSIGALVYFKFYKT